MDNKNKKSKKKPKESHNVNGILVVMMLVILVVVGCLIGYLVISANSQQKKAKQAAAEQVAAQQAADEQAIADQKKAAEEQAAAEQAAAEQAAAEAAQKSTTVRLCMVGDVLLSDRINNSCLQGDGSYDYNVLFQNISPMLSQFDLKIVNEETPCGGVEYGVTGYPSFNSPHSAQDAMVNAGFNCVCLATNHMLDYGPDPLFSTLNYWHTTYPDVATIGAYDSEEASNEIYVYTKDDLRIAVLNYTYGSNSGNGTAYGYPWCENELIEDEVFADVQRAHELADFVIVCPHWGTEYNLGTDDSQNYWTDLFLQWGVDLVIGTHPHVTEPIQQFTSDTGHSMVVFYSIGNFVSSQDSADSMLGAMADVTIVKDATGVYISDFGAIPLVTQKSYNYTTYYLSDYNADLAAASDNAASDGNFSYEYMVSLANSMFGDRQRNIYDQAAAIAAEDQTAADQATQDQTAQDQTAQDQTAQDQTAQDQAAQDQAAQDQAAQDQTAAAQ